MEKKLIATVSILSVIILILGYIIFGSQNKKNTQVKLPSKNEIVYYYGATCPHCKDVEEWIKKNKVDEKIKIQKKEEWNNHDNASEMIKVAESCGLDTTSIGVPFLWDDGQCYIGTPDVTRVLSEKAKINNK
jgi:glutaredoxin